MRARLPTEYSTSGVCVCFGSGVDATATYRLMASECGVAAFKNADRGGVSFLYQRRKEKLNKEERCRGNQAFGASKQLAFIDACNVS